MTVIKWGEVISVIIIFVAETPDGKYPCKKWNILYIISPSPLNQIIKIKIYAIW